MKRVNDLRYEIKFENRKSYERQKWLFLLREIFLFFHKQTYNVFYSWKYIFFKNPKNLIASAFFCRGRY